MTLKSLCEEVIRSEGKCGLTRNEMTQMARFALRAIRNENPWMRNGLRYLWLRDQWLGHLLKLFDTTDTSDVGLDFAIDMAISATGPSTAANQQHKPDQASEGAGGKESEAR